MGGYSKIKVNAQIKHDECLDVLYRVSAKAEIMIPISDKDAHDEANTSLICWILSQSKGDVPDH
jgi:hypothetical protein